MEHLGLVGGPTSGHADVFRALTGIEPKPGFEPTPGVVHLPDARLDALAAMSESKKVVEAAFEIVYIPDLDARLLGQVRNADALCVVAPASDLDAELAVVEEKLVIADLESVESRVGKQRRAAKGDKDLLGEVAALERAEALLSDGLPLYRTDLTPEERALLAPAFLLTNKPALTVANVDEAEVDRLAEIAAGLPEGAVAVCGSIEAEIAALEPHERAEMLEGYGIADSVVPRLASAALHLLGRRVFFTTGDKESRSWTFRDGSTAPECAGVIHSDLQRGFIRAEVIHWDELLEIGAWGKAKETGKLRVEGKDYVVRDGDVMEIRFNV